MCMCVCMCVCVCVCIAPNFHEIAENPMIENFRDKNFVIATFFRDYHRTEAPVTRH